MDGGHAPGERRRPLRGFPVRDCLVFLFFLALSYVFWQMMVLNDNYDREVCIPFVLVDVPDDVVLLSPAADTVRVTVSDKGFALLRYKYGDYVQPVRISFGTYRRDSSCVYVPSSATEEYVSRQLAVSSKVVSIKPGDVTFLYNYGQCKRVPVRWQGTVRPGGLYYVSNVKYRPDSVNVYAQPDMLDSIDAVYTQTLDYRNFDDTLRIACGITDIPQAKCVPDRVSITFCTDVLVDATVDGVPVTAINTPPGKILRLFPSKVSVRFVAGMRIVKNVSPDDFTVVADYNEIAAGADKCTLRLRAAPQDISKIRLGVSQVDYLIEDAGEREQSQSRLSYAERERTRQSQDAER